MSCPAQGKLHLLGADLLTIKFINGYMPRYWPRHLGRTELRQIDWRGVPRTDQTRAVTRIACDYARPALQPKACAGDRDTPMLSAGCFSRAFVLAICLIRSSLDDP